MASERDIARGLDRAYHKAERALPTVLDLATARCIILSDQHKGARDGADDFARCERAYRAALGYYLVAGYTLYVLGDVEELWECRAKSVIRAYRSTLELEAEFYRNGRYVRCFGNHDDQWENARAVEKYLHQFYPGLIVEEAMLLEVADAGQRLGRLFLVHGHQGSGGSDRFRWISKPVVRYLWRPLQRLTGAKLNTPAQSFELRAEHGRAMHAWAAGRARTVLIAGHTHKPVFLAEPQAPRLRTELAALTRAGAALSVVAEKRAEVEWYRSLEETAGNVPSTPCYFNTGCCVFDDGDITGIEIAEGEIRLVRWPDDAGSPRRTILRSADLRRVFNECEADGS